MEVERFERDLGQVCRGRPSAWPVGGSGRNEATSFAWMPKPAAIMKTRYWLPGFGSPM